MQNGRASGDVVEGPVPRPVRVAHEAGPTS
jgi:hypothetical protein